MLTVRAIWCLLNTILSMFIFLLATSTPALAPFLSKGYWILIVILGPICYLILFVPLFFQSIFNKTLIRCNSLQVIITIAGILVCYSSSVETRVHMSNSIIYLSKVLSGLDVDKYNQNLEPTEPYVVLAHSAWDSCESQLIYDPENKLAPPKFAEHPVSVYHVNARVISRFWC